MEKYNITQLIMNNLRQVCMPGPNREKIIEYYLNKDLVAVLGDNEISKDNAELLTIKDSNNTKLKVDSIYFTPIEITCSATDKSGSIMAISNDQIVFHIIITDDELINDSYFAEGQLSVHEIQKVSYEHNDAATFSLARSENGDFVYDGELAPILVKHNEMEYFQFRSNMEIEKKTSPSILARIVDSLRDDSVISIHTSGELHSLANYANGIFAALRTKLESYRTKDPQRVRKDSKKND